jgi:lipid-A-disaccharide synthase-like uncharacterized protein
VHPDLAHQILAWLHAVFIAQLDAWVILGWFAQLMFSGRFLVQWLASERARRSVVPVAFWYFSVIGGALLFAYALSRRDPVFIVGQGAGLFIYLRNLWLIRREHRASLTATEAGGPTPDVP